MNYTQNSPKARPSMSVDFDQLKLAATDASIARLYRTQWGLDHSVTGKVYCTEEECRERLEQGLLPPVLTPAQFARISQGLPYGDPDNDPDPGMTVQTARSSAGSGTDPYSTHPSYAEWRSLSVPVKEALRNDFRVFLDLKQRGRLDAVVNAVHEQLARDAERAAADERKRAEERAIEAAASSPEFQQLLARRNARRNQSSRG